MSMFCQYVKVAKPPRGTLRFANKTNQLKDKPYFESDDMSITNLYFTSLLRSLS